MQRDGAPHVVFATYTMARPSAVGVFFRALRLGFEFERRGWSVSVCNMGPLPDDPTPVAVVDGDVRATLRPFQVLTLRLR